MNHIRVVIEAVAANARRSVAEFRQEIARADGAVGKFRAAWSGLGQLARANAGLLATAAVGVGAAIVRFGAQSVTAYTNAALAAGKFSDAVGLSSEEASRWLSVASDVGIESSKIESAFLKLNRAIGSGSPVLEEYGISAQRAANGQVDVNETMLRAIDIIGRIQDPTERARVAQEAFGRSYAEVAEILFRDVRQLRSDLAATHRQELINEDEVEKARKQRAALDNLGDAVNNLQMVIGEKLLPVLTPLVEQVAETAQEAAPAAEAAGDLAGAWIDVKNAIEDVPGLGWWFRELSPMAWATQGFVKVWQAAELTIDRAQELGERIFPLLRRETVNVTEGLDELDRAARGRAAPGLKRLADEQEDAAAAAREHERELDRLERRLDASADAQRRMVESLADQRRAVDDLISLQDRLLGGELDVQDARARATEALREYEEAAANGVRSAERLMQLQQAQVKAERAAEQADRAVENARRDAERADREVQAAKRRKASDEEIAELEEKARQAQEAVYQAEDRERDARSAIDDARRRVQEEERKASPEELAELQRRATRAQLDAARAAAQYEADLREANGEQLTAADRTRLFQGALGDLGTALAPGSAVRRGLDEYVTALDDVIAKEQEAIEQLNTHRDRLRDIALSLFTTQQERGQGRFQPPFAVRGEDGTPASAPRAPAVQQNIQVILPPGTPALTADHLERYRYLNGNR